MRVVGGNKEKGLHALQEITATVQEYIEVPTERVLVKFAEKIQESKDASISKGAELLLEALYEMSLVRWKSKRYALSRIEHS